ncbi:MAG: carbamate kinase [Candidatus Aenigmarchaeota archaeon]
MAGKTHSKGTVVVALGGNALIRKGQRGEYKEQLRNVEHAMATVAGMIKDGYRVVMTHGNGPQVGSILLQQERTEGVPKMPLHVCVAQTQAQIGLMIQEALYNRLKNHMPVVTMVTQVIVDPKDKAFRKPTKPIGPFYEDEGSLPLGWHIIRTRRGYRRIVASPDPKEIVEAEAIKELSRDAVVIACGGGGIPVIKSYCKVKGRRRQCGLKGISAVIDKDLSAQKLADVVGADILLILTDVDQVSLNYGKPTQYNLHTLKYKDAKQYLKEGHFPAGTMGPKIKASLRFLEKRRKGKVIITSFSLADKALKGKAGTTITRQA